MVLALLTVLGTTTLSGMKLYAVEEGEGPFASNIQLNLINQLHADSHKEEHSEYSNDTDEEAEEFWEEIHEASISLLLMLIVLHVLGVALASKQHKENLARSMVTGNKSPLS